MAFATKVWCPMGTGRNQSNVNRRRSNFRVLPRVFSKMGIVWFFDRAGTLGLPPTGEILKMRKRSGRQVAAGGSNRTNQAGVRCQPSQCSQIYTRFYRAERTECEAGAETPEAQPACLARKMQRDT